MKKIIVIFFFSLLFTSCERENDNYRSIGTITGVDGTMCMCCGGWIIYIDESRYLIDSMPKDSDLDLSKETFPVTVKLDWQLVDGGCSFFGRISVQRIKKI